MDRMMPGNTLFHQQGSVKQSFHPWLWITVLITVSRFPWLCCYRWVVWCSFRLWGCLWISKPAAAGQWHSVSPPIKSLVQPLVFSCVFTDSHEWFGQQHWSSPHQQFGFEGDRGCVCGYKHCCARCSDSQNGPWLCLNMSWRKSSVALVSVYSILTYLLLKTEVPELMVEKNYLLT